MVFEPSKNVVDCYDKQYSHGTISEWRMLGAKYKAERIQSLCKKNNFAPRNILEIGSGDGAILTQLDRLGLCANLHGLEISDSACKLSNSLNIPSVTNITLYDGIKIPYSDDHFDMVVLSHVLEHVEHERILLREIKRVSKNLIIEVPIDFRPFADKNYKHFLSYGHINMYSPTTLRFLLLGEGFNIIDDLIGLYDIEVMLYNHFINQKKEPSTEKNINKKTQELENLIANYNMKTLKDKELSASYYTVLVHSGTNDLQIFK